MNWNTSSDCCNWDGVTCASSTGDVIGLDVSCGMLQDVNISSFLPAKIDISSSLKSLKLPFTRLKGKLLHYIFNLHSLETLDLGASLTNLESLDLSYNTFSVTTTNANHYVNPGIRNLGLASCKLKVFPNSFRAMKQLRYLDLSSNDIHGQNPDWEGEIRGNYGLRILNLSHNFITSLPQFQWYGLSQLYLQYNLIQGPFPQLICNMSNLMYLDTSNNRFGGSISQCFGKITSYIEMIDMGNNKFLGTNPNVYGDCASLKGISLNGNQLRGEVPSSLSKCSALSVLALGNNHLNGTFSGWLGDLPNLQALVLKSNNFHARIQPSSTVEFPFPRVDQAFLQISVDYTIIDMSNNTFEGHIPRIIGGLSSLIVLNLSHNNLIGPIPHALGNLTEIESLDLRIPEGPQFRTFDTSFGGNPGLYGSPLPKHEHRDDGGYDDGVHHMHMTDTAPANYATTKFIVNTLHWFFALFDYRKVHNETVRSELRMAMVQQRMEGSDFVPTSFDFITSGIYEIALLSLGMAHFHFGHPKLAHEVLIEVVNVSQQHNGDTCLAYTLTTICNMLSEVGISNMTRITGASDPHVSSIGTSLSVQKQLFVLLQISLKRANSLKLKRLVASNHLAIAKFDLTIGDLSLGMSFSGDLSPGNSCWGTLVRDSFPSDNPRRKDGLSTLHFLKFSENSFEVLKLLENSVEVLKILENKLELMKIPENKLESLKLQ
nr:leucine-rich repeat-containing protein [Tanacetum cinerariifolium]